MRKLLLENISREELVQHIKELYKFLRGELPKVDRNPKVFFQEDQTNADDFLGKTGYYDPDSEEIHLFVTDRHGKDILRSFAHEVIHHEQNCSGFTSKLDMSKTQEADYAERDKGLHEAERDAFERGNMLFRKWTDRLKADREKDKRVMNEKKVPKEVVKQAHKIGKSVAASGTAKEPFAVGMATAKKQAGIKEKKKKVKDPVADAREEAVEDARTHMNNYMGKDLEGMKEQSDFESTEALEENKEPVTPYPVLFEPKERTMQQAFNKREELIYQELIKRFVKNEG